MTKTIPEQFQHWDDKELANFEKHLETIFISEYKKNRSIEHLLVEDITLGSILKSSTNKSSISYTVIPKQFVESAVNILLNVSAQFQSSKIQQASKIQRAIKCEVFLLASCSAIIEHGVGSKVQKLLLESLHKI